MWRSSEALCDSVGLCRHFFTQCHSHSGMGLSLWYTLEVSHRVHTGVILQYAWYRYLCTLVCYCTPRYTYRSHFGSCIWDTTHSVGNASDYPACQHLRTISKDELLSHFYETPSIWGDRQNTPCSSFAKGPRFLDMVMTFVHTPLSHYNSITEPQDRKSVV